MNIKLALAGSTIGGIVGSLVPAIGTAAGAFLGALPGGLRLINNLLKIVELELDIGISKCILSDISLNPYLRKKADTTFQSDVPVIVTIHGVYRSVQPSDGDGDLEVLAGFVKSIPVVSDIWSKTKTQLYFVKVFSNRSPLTLSDLNTTTVQQDVGSKFLRLGTISNANVVGNLSKKDSCIILTFTNNSDTQQSFTYEIIYENTGIAKKSVLFSGTVTPAKKLEPNDSKIYITEWEGPYYTVEYPN